MSFPFPFLLVIIGAKDGNSRMSKYNLLLLLK